MTSNAGRKEYGEIRSSTGIIGEIEEREGRGERRGAHWIQSHHSFQALEADWEIQERDGKRRRNGVRAVPHSEWTGLNFELKGGKGASHQ